MFTPNRSGRHADSSDPDARFEKVQIELLTAVGSTAAVAFEHAAEVERLETQNSMLQHDLGLRHDLVGISTAMAGVAGFIAKTGPTNATVLIRGESGTGKELVARASRTDPREL
jgi:transcriptional regulator with GAF, ATPase, and Fis domain